MRGASWLDRVVPPVTWPPCSNAGARIEQFTVERQAADLERLRAMIGHHGRYVPAGTYTKLLTLHPGGGVTLQMSDTPDECHDAVDFVLTARGRVLVTGLGLGVVANALLLKESVTHVTVLEVSQHVIDLVGPLLEAQHGTDRLHIRQADALAYKPAPGERYDWAWHDIWPDIVSSNLAEMTTLRRRWCRRIPAGHQLCWGEELLR